MDKKDGIIVILVLIILVLSVLLLSNNSATSTTTAKNTSNIPIELDNTPTVTQDQSYLSVGGLLKNNGNVDYNTVKVNVMCYSQDDKLLYEKNTTIATIKAGEDADYSIDVDNFNGGNVSYAKVTVLSATPTS